jgi:hypothetical protein
MAVRRSVRELVPLNLRHVGRTHVDHFGHLPQADLLRFSFRRTNSPNFNRDAWRVLPPLTGIKPGQPVQGAPAGQAGRSAVYRAVTVRDLKISSRDGKDWLVLNRTKDDLKNARAFDEKSQTNKM